jgi:hypothetical protein
MNPQTQPDEAQSALFCIGPQWQPVRQENLEAVVFSQ